MYSGAFLDLTVEAKGASYSEVVSMYSLGNPLHVHMPKQATNALRESLLSPVVAVIYPVAVNENIISTATCEWMDQSGTCMGKQTFRGAMTLLLPYTVLEYTYR